jgi:cytochrome c-type biogenesis protein
MLQLEVTVSFPLAFLAGLLSFLSPCVLPVVPGYVTFVSGATLEELREGGVGVARRRAAVHALAFGCGFGIVFITLGIAATAAGQALARSLPVVTRVGGVLVMLFGLHLLGLLRGLPGSGALYRERRVHLSTKPAGVAGSLAVGIAFGAGWSPCIGPVLASILLYAGLETTMAEGVLLLATYGLGLAVPFVGAALALNWFLAGMERVRRHLGLVERVAGVLLVLLGLMMTTGHFTALNAWLAGMGQLINLGGQGP